MKLNKTQTTIAELVNSKLGITVAPEFGKINRVRTFKGTVCFEFKKGRKCEVWGFVNGKKLARKEMTNFMLIVEISSQMAGGYRKVA